MAGIILNGSVIKGLILNGSPVSAIMNGVKVFPTEVPGPDPYNPLGLPPNTVRVKTNDGNAPTKGQFTTYETATLVAGTTDVYDVYKSGTNFTSLLSTSTNVVEVLGANTTGITDMTTMFSNCSSLISVPLFNTSSVTNMSYMFRGTRVTSVPLYNTSRVTNMTYMFSTSNIVTVPLFDTSSVTDMSYMFDSCVSLKSIPLFNTSRVTNMNAAFFHCYKVESGALDLYQQASTQEIPPVKHAIAFSQCGRDTTAGAAELAQIPSDWK